MTATSAPYFVIVDQAFLASSGPSELPSNGHIRVVDSPADIALERAQPGWSDGATRTAILLGASFDAALSAVADGGVWGWRVLATGTPSPRVLARVAPWSTAPPPPLAFAPVSNYAEKSARLAALEGALAQAGVTRAFVDGIVTATDECLQNAIFDAHPVLSSEERKGDFSLEPPVELGFEVEDGLVIVAVRDPYGAFDRSSFNAALLRRGGREASEPPREAAEAQRGLRIGFSVMLRYSSALAVEVQDGRSTTVRMVTDTKVPFRRFLTSGKILDFVSWGE